jgi:NAD(P)-dependent dehydrogenase (short-subunit alcohol dehydrogenase family)
MATKAVALVTGTNKGIGREIVRGLAQRHFTVLASARDKQRGEQAVGELASETLDVRFVRLDVTDEQSIAEAAQRISDEFGRLDVLVNNAGITNDLRVTPSETTTAAMRNVYDTNVFGVVAVTNAMLPLLKCAPAGRIVNVSSELGSMTGQAAEDSELPQFLAYNSSKTALNSITVQYARELRDTPVVVNTCAPGLCATDLNGYRGHRTPAEGAQIAIDLATGAEGGRTVGFYREDGPLPW